MAEKFTVPKVSMPAGKPWSIWFRYDGRIFRRTGDVNRPGMSTKERKEHLQALAQAWYIRLPEDRYNPIRGLCEQFGDSQVSASTGLPKTLHDAIKFAEEKKSLIWGKSSKHDYASVIKYLLQSTEVLGYTNLPIKDCKRSHYITLLQHVQQQRKLSAKGFNKYRSYLSSLFGELVQWEILEFNPITGIKLQPTMKVFAHKPPTAAERITIMKKLKSDYPGFYRYCSTLYGTTMREKEILALQVRDINLKAQTITIIPSRERDNSKVSTEREVIIPDTVAAIFVQLNLKAFAPTDYLFSKGFKPGPKRQGKNSATMLWKEIVKDGLKIEKDLYGLKQLAGNDMIDMQVENKKLLEMPRKQMGHTTTTITEVYLTRHKEILKDELKKGMKPL